MEETKTTHEKKVSKNETTHHDNEGAIDESYLTPASVVIGSIIVAIAILIAGNPSNNSSSRQLETVVGEPSADEVAANPVVAAIGATSLDAEELQQCAAESRYGDQVQSDIDNAFAAANPERLGTPWTTVIDTQTGERYALGGALPTGQVLALLDNNFADIPAEWQDGTNLDLVREIDNTDYLRGNPDARYIFVEYSDFDCPFCSRFHQTMKEVINARDDVAWVYRHLPLESLHPNARYVANVAECAGENGDNQNDFWSFADAYFNQG